MSILAGRAFAYLGLACGLLGILGCQISETQAPAGPASETPAPGAKSTAHREQSGSVEEPTGKDIEETTGHSAQKQAPPQKSVAPVLQNLPSPPSLPELTEGCVTGPGVVTSVEPQATRVGVGVLESGGNAVDAAIATAFALAVTHPSAGNLGGGGFLLLRIDDTIEAIDFREDAPAALTREKFDKMIEQGGRGAVSVGVPGTPAGLFLAHQRHGKLPWSQLLEGALQLAEGHSLGQRQAQTIAWSRYALRRDPSARKAFFPGGNLPHPGTRLVRPRLKVALERIQQQGASGFYRGPTASDLIASLGESGLITQKDLARYRARVRSPLFLDYEGARVITMPPPSAGGVAVTLNLSMLAALEAHQFPADSAKRYHLIAEVSRRAQVERRLLVTAPSRKTVDAQLRRRWTDPQTWLKPHPIDPEKATRSKTLHSLYDASMRELEHTTHLSVIDQDGNAASLTTTLSSSFGAQIVTRKTGIVLNNSVASFGSVGENIPMASARTISSMAPTLVLLGQRDMLVLGSPGGDTIPSTITQLAIALLNDRQSLKQAVTRPRIHQGFVPDLISIERLRPLPNSIITQLRQMGHTVRATRRTIGDANIASYFQGQAAAFADPREGGLALASKPSVGPPQKAPPTQNEPTQEP